MHIFFDQNVLDKVSKKRNKDFQNNIDQLIPKEVKPYDPILTPFGLIEFAGLNMKKFSSIQYKDKLLREYAIQSFAEFEEKIKPFLKKYILQKITECVLENALNDKIKRELAYLDSKGKMHINKYIKNIKFIYDELIENLFLDQLPQVNISQFSLSDREKFVSFCMNSAMEVICQGRIMGSLKFICRLFPEIKITQDKTGEFNKKSFNIDEQKCIDKKKFAVIEEIKPGGDLVDCELIHLAFFGSNNQICYCYTTDDKKKVKEKMLFYCKNVKFLIYVIWNGMIDSNIANRYKRPQWKFGTVFILDKSTGAKISEISAQKIYYQKCF